MVWAQRVVAGRAVSRRQSMLIFVGLPFKTGLHEFLDNGWIVSKASIRKLVHFNSSPRSIIQSSRRGLTPQMRDLSHNVFEGRPLSLSAPTSFTELWVYFSGWFYYMVGSSLFVSVQLFHLVHIFDPDPFVETGLAFARPDPASSTSGSGVKRSRRSGGTKRRGQRFTPSSLRWPERALGESNTRRGPKRHVPFSIHRGTPGVSIVYFLFMRWISFRFLLSPGDASPR